MTETLVKSEKPRGVAVRCSYPDCDGYHHPNLSLLGEVLRAIMFKPFTWRQDHWAIAPESVMLLDKAGLPIGLQEGSCGAAFCAAGWATMIERLPMVWDEMGDGTYQASNLEMRAANGGTLTVEDAAMHLLGLNFHESKMLFDGSNTLTAMLEASAEITRRAEEELDEHGVHLGHANDDD